MPELKNVRIASVGVETIGSPRRLKDVFITTRSLAVTDTSFVLVLQGTGRLAL
jgi:hypothetical protein